MILTPEKAANEYVHLLEFLKDQDLLIDARKFWIFGNWKYKATGEVMEYGLRYFERAYQEELLHLFNENDWEGILQLPMGEYGRCATQIATRYCDSGEIVSLQVYEARPHEDGRTVGLTPGKVFIGEEGKAIVQWAKQIDQGG